MPIVRMNIPQYEDLRHAQKIGDKVSEEALMTMGYNKNYNKGDVFIVDVPEVTEVDDQDILDDVAAGMDNKDIYKKYDISSSMLVAIKKRNA